MNFISFLLWLRVATLGLASVKAFVVTTSFDSRTFFHVRRSQPSYFSARLYLNEPYDIEAASVKLSWENADESSQKPILDLSSRDLSPEDAAAAKREEEDTSDWDQGQRWKKTQEKLSDLGFSETDTDFLKKCPQLLRLETGTVIPTAEWIVNEFGIEYGQSEPKFLCYPVDDVTYGLDLMSTMMMTPDARPSCLAMPALFLSMIEEGIRERAVKEALGMASDATYRASQNVAGNAMASLKQLKNRKLGGLGGG